MKRPIDREAHFPSRDSRSIEDKNSRSKKSKLTSPRDTFSSSPSDINNNNNLESSDSDDEDLEFLSDKIDESETEFELESESEDGQQAESENTASHLSAKKTTSKKQIASVRPKSKKARKKSKSVRNLFIQNEASEENDEDEYDSAENAHEELSEEESEEEVRSSRKRKSRKGRHPEAEEGYEQLVRNVQLREKMRKNREHRIMSMFNGQDDTIDVDAVNQYYGGGGGGSNDDDLDEEDRDYLEEDRDVFEDGGEDEEGFGAYYRGKMSAELSAAQESLQPSVEDPKLFFVRCLIGKEKETVVSIMRKYMALKDTPTPLRIKSAIFNNALSGGIYIEAYKVDHVREAIHGLSALKIGQKKQLMLPLNQMTHVLRASKPKVSFKPNEFVRILRYVYKGDIAQVVDYDPTTNEVCLKIVPRISYDPPEQQNNNSKAATLSSNAAPSKSTTTAASAAPPGRRQVRRKPRPLQRLFDANEIRRIGGELQRDGDYDSDDYIYKNQRYQNGFLIKYFTTDAITKADVMPTLEELSFFKSSNASGASTLEISAATLSASVAAANSKLEFAAGDRVAVTEGELKGLEGIVTSVAKDLVSIKPSHEDLTDEVSFQKTDIVKVFSVGDHVKILSGEHMHQTGLITHVNDENQLCKVLRDMGLDEVHAFSKNLRLTSEVYSGQSQSANFKLLEPVRINKGEVCLVVAINGNEIHVLDHNDNVRIVFEKELIKERLSKETMVQDGSGRYIGLNSRVNIVDGKHRGKSGAVKFIYRQHLFIQSPNHKDQSGLVAVNRKFVESLASTKFLGNNSIINSNSNYQYPIRNPVASSMQPGNYQYGTNSMPPPGSAVGGNGNNAIARGAGSMSKPQSRYEHLRNKLVVITSGPFKSHKGIVCEISDTTAIVNLQSKFKKITVKPESILADQVANPHRDNHHQHQHQSGYSTGSNTFMNSGTRPYMNGSATYAANPGYLSMATNPFSNALNMAQSGSSYRASYASQTPEYGSQTPMYGTQTPSYVPSRSSSVGGDNTANVDDTWNPASMKIFTPKTPGYQGFPTTSSSGYSSFPLLAGGAAGISTIGGAHAGMLLPHSALAAARGPNPLISPSLGISANIAANHASAGGAHPVPSHQYDPSLSSTNANYAGIRASAPTAYTNANIPTAGPQTNLPPGWLLKGLEVNIVDGPHRGSLGVLREVASDRRSAKLDVYNGDTGISVQLSQVAPSAPSKNDKAVLISSEGFGCAGTVTAIHEKETIFSLENGPAQFYLLENLCKESFLKV